jgi:hypothetical protein
VVVQLEVAWRHSSAALRVVVLVLELLVPRPVVVSDLPSSGPAL